MKGNYFYKFLAAFTVFMSAQTLSFAQEKTQRPVSLRYTGDGGYSLVERTNLRRYVNGKYAGLTSREVRSFISPSEAPLNKFKAKGSVYENDMWYDGSFYVMEETLRNNQAAGAGIHEAVQSMFHISPEGRLTMYKDNGYPSFRSFPAYTLDKVTVGDSWKAQAERSVDPLNKGVFTRMPILVAYTFAGAEEYRGKPVYRIKALWQTNYGPSTCDTAGDTSLEKATGGHKADIIILQSTGTPILIIDKVDETFFWIDGTQVNFKGTITLFTEFPPALDTQKIMFALNRVATVKDGNNAADKNKYTETGKSAVSGRGGAKQNIGTTHFSETAGTKNNIVAEEVPAGIRLSIRDIKFAPDSASILPEERERLDQIADVLKLAPNSQFLVEGHTASVGKPAGEQSLSEQRARAVALELEKRGVKAAAFICRGWGGNKPVATNKTDTGRAQNRRVEITILK